ncbi:MAG: helix-turn-helix domain-containing protein [Terriglobales bacterium]|jgi:hypothetical protein
MTLADLEREAILDAVAELGVVNAARELGIGKSTVYRRLQEYGVTVHESQHNRLVIPPNQKMQSTFLLLAARQAATYLIESGMLGKAKLIGMALREEVDKWRPSWQKNSKTR